jgi:hypothetical protein
LSAGRTVGSKYLQNKRKEKDMVCSIADNTPLKKLQGELGLPQRCHGKRRECIRGFETRSGDFVMGLPGTALGYCQALFNYAGHPAEHTEKVIKLLNEIDAPWSYSHELFWGYRQSEAPGEYVEQGIKPLLGTGRVPVLITSLDPNRHRLDLQAIMATSPALPENETVLVRTVLADEDSVRGAIDMIRRIVARARATGAMPNWWPLLQGNLALEEWTRLRNELGTDWDYVNVAVNPFVSDDVFELVQDRITVAQIPVGLANGISADGWIELPAGMKITGGGDCPVYSVPRFGAKLCHLPAAPTLIVLGPAQPGWSDLQNQQRLAALMPALRNLCDMMWQSLSSGRREEVWRMVA